MEKPVKLGECLILVSFQRLRSILGLGLVLWAVLLIIVGVMVNQAHANQAGSAQDSSDHSNSKEQLFSAPLKIKAQGDFAPLSSSQQKIFRTLLQDSLRLNAGRATNNLDQVQADPARAELAQRWQKEHWLWRGDGLETGFWLTPQPGYEQGQGIFWFRAEVLKQKSSQALATAQIPILLQAPHRYHDRYTGSLVAKLTQVMPYVQVSSWNSLPRYLNKNSKTSFQDLARQQDTLFNLLALEFAREYPDSRIIQFHGYNHKKRRTPEGEDSRIILSNGTRQPDSSLVNLQQCLGQNFDKVRLYGLDINELGASVNITGKKLRKMDYAGFVHVELSLPVRKLLLSSEKHRQALAICLQQPSLNGLNLNKLGLNEPGLNKLGLSLSGLDELRKETRF